MDGTRRSADHLLRFRADGLDRIGSHIYRNDGRLAHDDTLALHEYQRVCRTQIDPNVVVEHDCFLILSLAREPRHSPVFRM